MKATKIILEDGSEVALRRKYSNGTYVQTSNGAGKSSKRRNLMARTEVEKLCINYRRRGWGARIVRHGRKYLLYTKSS